MNLSFDSIDDLNHFLHWADKYRAVDLTANRTRDLIGPAAAAVDDGPLPTIDASAGMPPPVTGDPSGAALQPAAEPTKRKRRTKAEIEADEKAAADAAAAEAEAHHVDTARVVHADGSVTTTSVGLPPDVNPSDVTGAPAGANPFEQVATAPASEPAAADTGSESDVVTPFQHLTRAREFIAKHSMSKYNESFAKAGLDANVMGYTAYQRAVHMAALDELEKV